MEHEDTETEDERRTEIVYAKYVLGADGEFNTTALNRLNGFKDRQVPIHGSESPWVLQCKESRRSMFGE